MIARNKQYKTRNLNTKQWTGWMEWKDGFVLNLDLYDAIEWQEKPAPCTAVAPFEVEGLGRPNCESRDAQSCVTSGTHHFDLEVEEDGYYSGDCYHTRMITWSALGG